jgi:hypothetical protein
MPRVPLVFVADVVEQIGIERDELVERDGPRGAVRLEIVDGELDLQLSVA